MNLSPISLSLCFPTCQNKDCNTPTAIVSAQYALCLHSTTAGPQRAFGGAGMWLAPGWRLAPWLWGLLSCPRRAWCGVAQVSPSGPVLGAQGWNRSGLGPAAQSHVLWALHDCGQITEAHRACFLTCEMEMTAHKESVKITGEGSGKWTCAWLSQLGDPSVEQPGRGVGLGERDWESRPSRAQRRQGTVRLLSAWVSHQYFSDDDTRLSDWDDEPVGRPHQTQVVWLSLQRHRCRAFCPALATAFRAGT